MTNTLTWDIKPIESPKINSNLLSVVSLILLLAMTFLTVAVIAEHCEDLRDKYRTASENLIIASIGVLTTSAAVVGACGIAIHNIWIVPASLPIAITAGLVCLTALGSWAAAIWWYNRKFEAYHRAYIKLRDCLKSHQDDTGSCDTGSCDGNA